MEVEIASLVLYQIAKLVIMTILCVKAAQGPMIWLEIYAALQTAEIAQGPLPRVTPAIQDLD